MADTDEVKILIDWIQQLPDHLHRQRAVDVLSNTPTAANIKKVRDFRDRWNVLEEEKMRLEVELLRVQAEEARRETAAMKEKIRSARVRVEGDNLP